MSISISSAMAEGANILDAAGLSEGLREAGSLLAHTLGQDRAFLLTHAEDLLTAEQLGVFRVFVARRAAREPLQYITGRQEFFKLDFEVTPDVLIPRPETEIIVEVALELLKDDPGNYFAEVGTGSGCIAISLLHELPDARAVAIDVSPAALLVAKRNADRHGVSERLILLESDCFSGIEAIGPFALIASNPPYVFDSELKDLQREVRHEPRAALAGGADGLSIIRRLLYEAPPFLRSGGYLVFEIGFGQAESVEQLIDRHVWNLFERREDLQGIPRTFVLQKK